MWRLIGFILERYGLGVAQLGVIIYCFWKLFTNHLKHISQDIKDNKEELKSVGTEIKDISNRVSKIEGKIKL